VRKSGRFGPYIEMGEGKEAKRASIPKDLPDGELTLDWAVKLLSLPRTVGEHPETGKPITASIGRFGPYLAHDGKYARLKSTADVFETGMNAAVVKLAEAAERSGPRKGAEPLKVLGAHPTSGGEVKLMAGRYGPYVTDGTTNATLPKAADPDALTLEEAAALIDARAAAGPSKKKSAKKAAPKKAAAKKTPAKEKTAKAPAKKKAKAES
jgi:DNA topoisomerase-1